MAPTGEKLTVITVLTELSSDTSTSNPSCLIQPRMTSRLCLKRYLALPSSTINFERLWQQRGCSPPPT